MKILSTFRFHWFVIVLFLCLSSCSSHKAPSSARLNTLDEVVVDETVLADELAGLNRLHSWRTVRSDQHLRQYGIDPSLYDFPIVMNDQVQYYLDLFQGKQRKSFQRQLERSGMYLAQIKKELKAAGLPQDLAYLAMIESGYNPTICSHANACGMWQFIESTGRNYNLAIDSWIDERRAPEKATRAAIRYLSKLYGDFNDWHLAVAAYNAGEYRVAKAIETYNTKDFWVIAESEGIYLETKRYVPKLIAAIIIARDPVKYGFTELNYLPPPQHELVHVPGGTELEAISVCSGDSVQDLRGLNTELRKNRTPPVNGHYALRVPVGKKDLVTANLSRLCPINSVAYLNHTVRKGENANTICKRYGISKKSLLSANKLRSAKLKQGMRLRIPSQTTRYVLLKDGERREDLIARYATPQNNASQSGREEKLYRVRSGDTLYRIARLHNVSVQELKQWNNLSGQTNIRVGQQLAVGLTSPGQTDSRSGARIAMAPSVSSRSISSPDPGARTGSPRSEEASGALRSTPARLARAESRPVPGQGGTMAAQASVSVKPESTSVAAVPVRVKKPAAIARNTVAGKPSSRPRQASTWYVVQNGDSLWGIARKFQTTPQDLRQWNQLSSNDLHTGNKIIVKKL